MAIQLHYWVNVKLPSITQAAADARITFVRFPVALLVAIVGTVCALALIDNQESSEPSVLIQIVFGAILGFPLLTGLTLISEKWKWGKPLTLVVQLTGIAFIWLYSMTIPPNLDNAPSIYPLRQLMLTIGMTLFAFAAPFIKHENELGYWNFCKVVCLRVFTTGFYTIVLSGGLAIALAALHFLFGVEIPEKRYGELTVFIGGIFAIWYFLAGVPKNLESLDDDVDYPKELKVFSQYILFPLTLIYFVILYAYLGKIVLAWDWPKGWVSKLILGFIATGFISLLLVHPIKDRIENIWIKRFSRWFYVVIVPLTTMLFLAVWQRVSDYGITEGRYLGIATVVWLSVLTPYFIFSRKKRILFLPASLCVVVLIVSFGPWGMFTVSEQSQVNRLKEFLVKNHILVNGQIQSNHDSLRWETTREIGSILGYLSEVHGFNAIQPWFSESLKQDSVGNGDAYKDPELVAKLMGVQYVHAPQTSVDGTITLTIDREQPLEIDGYERLLRRQRIHTGITNREFSDYGIAYRVGQDLSTVTVSVRLNTNSSDSLQIDLKPLVEKLLAEYGKVSTNKIPPEKMAIVSVDQTTMIKVFLSNISVQQHVGKLEIVSYEVDIAYKQGTEF